MTEGVAPSVAFIGFESSGKSSYLGAFFIGSENSSDGMALVDLSHSDRTYLNELADSLGSMSSVPRTQQSEPQELDLGVRLADGQEGMRLVIPDLSGELLREAMNDRILDRELSALLLDTPAILLFTRVDNVRRATQLEDLTAALKAAGEAPEGSQAEEDPEAWSMEQAATQARLADVLQELIRLRGTNGYRVGIVLSAWDTRETADETPLDWAARELTLPLQVLDSADLDWTVFGVSAQGGDFKNEEDRKRLQKEALPGRGTVAAPDGTDAGIGAPLRWALQ